MPSGYISMFFPNWLVDEETEDLLFRVLFQKDDDPAGRHLSGDIGADDGFHK